ncbi:hypothetical protein HDU93_003547 [Gonapodya sp. JEL0774]|nr:hypothetical protein HDU93_003547 [Gonapodya sp. JEL0774]
MADDGDAEDLSRTFAARAGHQERRSLGERTTTVEAATSRWTITGIRGNVYAVEVLCCGIMFLSGALYSCTIPILPPLVAKIGRSKDLGFLFAFYPCGSLVFNPLVGIVSAVYLRKPNSVQVHNWHPLDRRRYLLLLALAVAFTTCLLYSITPTFEILCLGKLTQALTDAVAWVCTLETWEKFCSEQATARERMLKEQASLGELPGTENVKLLSLPHAAHGSTRILASAWAGQVVALPVAGYLYDNGDWVFAPVAVLDVLLVIGWLLVDMGPPSGTGKGYESWRATLTQRAQTAVAASTANKQTLLVQEENTAVFPGNETPYSCRSRHVSTEEEILIDSDTSETSQLLPSSLPQSNHSHFSKLIPPVSVILLAIPLLCATFVSSGLEPTLPQYLRHRFSATPTEVGGVYYLGWSAALILGMVLGGAVLEDSTSGEAADDTMSGITALIGGMIGVGCAAPLVALPAWWWSTGGPGIDSVGPSALFIEPFEVAVSPPPLLSRIAEVVALCCLGFATGFTMAPTLPEMSRAVKREAARRNRSSVSRNHSSIAEGDGGVQGLPVGTADVEVGLDRNTPLNSEEAPSPTETEVGATLYGFWCFMYSVGMTISQPLSTYVFDTYGFSFLMYLDTVLMAFLGIPAMLWLRWRTS